MDGPQMHADCSELTVERRNHALARRRAAITDRKRLSLHVRRDGHARDREKRRREIDVSDRFVDLEMSRCVTRRGAPYERYVEKRGDVIGAFEHEAVIALQLAVIGG